MLLIKAPATCLRRRRGRAYRTLILAPFNGPSYGTARLPGVPRTAPLAVAVLLSILAGVTPAAAQTEGKVSVGAAVTRVIPTDEDVSSLWGYGLVVRLNPKPGWGVAAGLSWFQADIENPGGEGGFADMKIRPLLAGVAYTFGRQPLLASVSLVAGPSFNDLDFDDDYLASLPPGPQPDLDAKTSLAVRGGVGVTWTVAKRVAILGFAGYIWNRPDLVYTDTAGREFRNRWKADAVLLSVGAVYSLF